MKVNPVQIRRLVQFATRRTGTPSFDEDLAQEAALRVLAALRRNTRIENPRAFLMKIVQDTVSDHWRRRRTEEDIASIDERFVSDHPDFEARIDARRRLEMVRTALSGLEPQKRATVLLYYRDGLPVSEIARLQSRSPSAVKMELLRARRDLARIVQRVTKKKSR